MRRVTGAVVAAGLAATTIAAAATPAAAADKYRNWTRTPGNAAGVVFYPKGDRFVIYDNRYRDGYPAVVIVAYRSSSGRCPTASRSWHLVGGVYNGKHTIAKNVKEHRYICFRVHSNYTPGAVSPVVYYRTS